LSAKTPISLLKGIVFTLVAVALVWLCLELFILVDLWLRPWGGPSDEVVLYGPHPYRAFAPVPNTMDRVKRRSFNSLGLRGPEISIEKPADTIRILCLGGSTTFSDGATTNATTYPARMERLLREHYRDAPFRIEVVNAGVQAYNSLESLIYFQTSLLDLSPDIAVFHHAINDCWFMVEMPGFQSDFSHARRTFTIPPPKRWEYSPFLSWWFSREASLSNLYFPPGFVNLNVPVLVHPEIATDPMKGLHGEMEPRMVAAFERNTRNFLSVARGNGVIPVISTQSFCDDGGRWTRSLAQLNQVTRDIATSESVGMIDFAQILPWNSEDYYDWSHLTDTPNGLGRQAEIFAQGLINMRAIEQAWEKRLKKKQEVRG